jgi:hypothetical protein
MSLCGELERKDKSEVMSSYVKVDLLSQYTPSRKEENQNAPFK